MATQVKLGKVGSPLCTRGAPTQDGEHLTPHCPRFNGQRASLRGPQSWGDLDKPIGFGERKGRGISGMPLRRSYTGCRCLGQSQFFEFYLFHGSRLVLYTAPEGQINLSLPTTVQIPHGPSGTAPVSKKKDCYTLVIPFSGCNSRTRCYEYAEWWGPSRLKTYVLTVESIA